jgi:hypothetical protein
MNPRIKLGDHPNRIRKTKSKESGKRDDSAGDDARRNDGHDDRVVVASIAIKNAASSTSSGAQAL